MTGSVRQFMMFLLATVSGTAASLAFAPVGWQLMALPTLMVLFFLTWRLSSFGYAFFYGLAFNFAFFSAGLWWIYDALSGHIGLPPVAAVLLTISFCLFLACFPAAGLAAAVALTLPNGLTRLLTLAAGWTLMEWVRSWLLSGFPWLTFGYSQIPGGWLAAWAPLAGILGVSLALTITVSCLLALAQLAGRRLIALLIIVLLPATAALASNVWSWTTSAGNLKISLLQGNVKQSLKWEPQQVEQALKDYQRLAQSSEGRVIIFPETALPMLIDQLPVAYVDQLRDLAHERYGAVIAGMFVQEGEQIYNVAVALEKEKTQVYRKVHLTPYGEYLPFADFLRPLLKAADIPYSGLSAGSAAQPLISLPDGISAGVSICYEDVFGNEWRRQLPEALFLINVTNDAWFEPMMLHQHFQMAQARALESGRYLVRATNTGITAVVDPSGNMVARLPGDVRGVLNEEITLYRGATPYVLLGDGAVVAIACLILLGGAGIRIHRFYKRR